MAKTLLQEKVLVTITTPLTAGAATAELPATTTLGECVKLISAGTGAVQGERHTVQQIRREIAGARFDILVVAEGGETRRAEPGTSLSDWAQRNNAGSAERPDGVLTAQLEVQAYAPVA